MFDGHDQDSIFYSVTVDQAIAQAAARYVITHCDDATDILAALGIEAR